MATIKHRRATRSQWASENPILSAGEIGFEIDTNRIKVGNGLSPWISLTYFIDEATVRTMVGSGGGVGSSIDDGDTSLFTTWSSEKVSSGLESKVNESENMFVIATEAGFINIRTGELVDGIPGIDDEDGKFTLQHGLGMLYQMLVNQSPKYVEEKRLVDGLLSEGQTPYQTGFVRNPTDVSMNEVQILMASLDVPSSSGPVRYKTVVTNVYNSYVDVAEWEIPEGVTEVYYAPNPQGGDPGSERPNTYISGNVKNDYRMVLEILDAGVGASGLNVRVVRFN